jgi:signal transduction histidine kinase
MKQQNLTIFRRFAIIIFSLITVLGLLFIIITYLATTYYHQASTQLLNKEVAAHIAEFTSPFTPSGIDKRKADSVFKSAMVLSPSAEVYFLDTSGKVIYYEPSEKQVRVWNIPLPPIRTYIAAKGEKYIRNTDPRDPDHSKIFSAAEVYETKKSLGYIYVILGSEKSKGITDLIFGSHILNLAIRAFVIIILLSFVLSFIYLKRIRRNFQQMISVLERFESGDYAARFNLKKQGELEPVTSAFNKMADLLSTAISKLTKSEKERKNFIATISHDLRTPLSIARGYTETLLLKREKGDVTAEEQERYSQLIYSKMLQIENMVKQLFELSRMDAVEFKPFKEPFVLAEIVQEAITTFQLIASEKKISLKCVQCLYHVWINADISMLERVVQNLIENALKNTPEGGYIKTLMIAEGNELIFKIENNGPPLSHDLIQWINQFRNVDMLLEKRPQKSGLGLVIVQRILHLHGAALNAHVADGINTFSFRLPVYKMPS